MKKTFTKEYMLSNRGCYSKEKMMRVNCINNKKITLKQLFRDLPIRDFTWFLVQKCDLTLTQKREFAIHCAKQVLPIYEEKYPKDKRIRECIEATEQFSEGKISVSELMKKRKLAAASDAASAAASAAASDAAAYSAAASAAASASAASAAAAYSAAASASAAYSAAASASAAYSAASASAYSASDAAYSAAYSAAASASAAASDAAYKTSIWEWVVDN